MKHMSTLVQEGSSLKTINNPNVWQLGNKQIVKSSFNGVSLKEKKKWITRHATGIGRKKDLKKKKRRQPHKNMYYVDSIYMYVAQNKNTDSMSVEIQDRCWGLEINYKAARETFWGDGKVLCLISGSLSQGDNTTIKTPQTTKKKYIPLNINNTSVKISIGSKKRLWHRIPFPFLWSCSGRCWQRVNYTAIMSHGGFLGSPVGREGEGTGEGYWEPACAPQKNMAPEPCPEYLTCSAGPQSQPEMFLTPLWLNANADQRTLNQWTHGKGSKKQVSHETHQQKTI